MPTSNQRKGKVREKYTEEHYQRMGWQTMRSSRSLGPFDVVAWDAVSIHFVQVKLNGYLTATEREQIQLVRVPPNGVKMLARFRTGSANPILTELE